MRCLFISIAFAVAGCSTPAPAPGGSTTSNDVNSTPTPQPGAALDVDAGPDLCRDDGLQATSDPIEELVVRGTPPDPIGGEVLTGTYVLSELNRFQIEDSSRLTGVVARRSLVLTATTYQIVDAAQTRTVSAGQYHLKGTSIVMDATCPTPGSITYGYSAVGGSFAIYTATDRRETYVRR